MTKRKDCKSGNHYYFIDSKNKKWSIVDIRNMMSTAPFYEEHKKLYDYWEAIRMNKDGELNTDIMLREKTSKELLNKIERHDP